MHRVVAMSCESLSVEGFPFFLSHHTLYKAAKPPNLVFLGFRLKLLPKRSLFFPFPDRAWLGRVGREKGLGFQE